ncbi:type IV pilus modification PilV family protein [Desulfatiferula olefinivorans]
MIENHVADGERGFTIVEVMIAIVIFSIGVLAVAQMQVRALNAGRQSFNQTEAAMWAANQAETFVSLPFTDPALANGTNTVGDGMYQLNWTVSQPGADPGTLLIQITVTWNDRNVAKNLVFDYVKVQGI